MDARFYVPSTGNLLLAFLAPSVEFKPPIPEARVPNPDSFKAFREATKSSSNEAKDRDQGGDDVRQADKCRSKTMKLVAATVGVDSVALAGDGKDQVVVVGDGIDSVKLTNALRKKVGHAQLLQVGEVKEEEKKKPAVAAAAASVVEYTYPWHYYQYPSHAVPVYEHPAGAYGYQQYHSWPNTCWM